MKIKLGQVLSFIEKSSTVLSILWLTGGVDTSFLALVAYPTSVFFLLMRWKETLWKSMQELFLWLFLGWTFLSVFWAANFSASLYMNLKLVGTIIIGLSLGIRYSLKEQLQILAWAFGLAAILSLFYCLVLPQKGIMAGSLELEGAWQGIYSQKNVLGRNMTISSLVFLLQLMICTRYRWLIWCGLSLSFALVILSTSKTALVVLITLLALMPLYRALRLSYSLLIPCLSIVVLMAGSLALLLLSQLDIIFGSLGKDATLTGRIPLWETVFTKIWERPWLGYGYGGFWLGWEGESADIWRIEIWEPPHAHNGLIDIWISIGLIGVILAILTFAFTLLRSFWYIRFIEDASGIWPLWFLTLLFLTNFTESTLDSRSIMWAFYVAIVISTHRKVVEYYTSIFRYSIKPKLTIIN